jgi:RNA polymerase sigma-70 factor (ECF subfamily)
MTMPSRERRDDGNGDAAMEQYARGDDGMFEQVYDAVAARLLAYLRRHVHDSDRCRDLLQETFLHIHRSRGTFLPGAAVMPWAFAIARRLLLDEARRASRALPLADLSDPLLSDFAEMVSYDDRMVEEGELVHSFLRELARLPEAQRTAFELLKQEGLTLAEAAQVLGVTTTAVKLRAHRAYVTLRAALGVDRVRLTEATT